MCPIVWSDPFTKAGCLRLHSTKPAQGEGAQCTNAVLFRYQRSNGLFILNRMPIDSPCKLVFLLTPAFAALSNLQRFTITAPNWMQCHMFVVWGGWGDVNVACTMHRSKKPRLMCQHFGGAGTTSHNDQG